MIECHKTNWNQMLFLTLWAYQTTTKTAIGFIPFHLVHGIKSIIPIECEIPTLHTILTLLPNTTPLEQLLLHSECLNEDRWDSLEHNKAHKAHTKAHFDQLVQPHNFFFWENLSLPLMQPRTRILG